MSSQAIKNFFRSQKRGSRLRTSKKDEPKDVPISYSTMDIEEAILTGKHFDSESLYKYLSNYTHQYIEDEEPEPVLVKEVPVYIPKRNYGIRLVDLTDEMIRQKEQEEAYREEEEYLRSYQSYVPPPRPTSDIDIRFEQMNVELERCKKELDEELIKPLPNTRGYVPPTRKKEYNEEFNPNVGKIKYKIGILENGIKDLGAKIIRENDRWIENKKLMYRTEYNNNKYEKMFEMYEKMSNDSYLQMY